jgi:oligosaccharide repeat unit polymerase
VNAPPLALPVRAAFARLPRRVRVFAAAAQLWWLRPAPLVLCVIVPLYLSFLSFDYENVVPRRYVPSENYWWGLLLLGALALGAALAGGRNRIPPGTLLPAPAPMRIPGVLTASLLVFTVTAYLVWFGPLTTQPQLIGEIFNGDRDNLRGELQTLPGVTTLTQCGIAFVVLVTIKRYQGTALAWERAGVWLVIALAVGRALLWSERLAVLEVVVPCAVTAAAFYRFRTRQGARLALVLPLIGPVLLFFAFAGTEYFRSWRFYQDYYDSIWQFSYERLMTYYAVATNSGVGLLEEMRNWPQYTGRFVFEWAWSMPKLGPILTDTFGDVRLDFGDFLLDYGDREFNNPSGLFPIVYDIGYFGSAIYFFLVGLVIGLLRRSYAQKQPFGLLFYPFCVLFILELLRFNYLASSRFIPAAGSLFIAMLLHYEWPRARHRRRRNDGRTT